MWAGLASRRDAVEGIPLSESTSWVLRFPGFNWINKLWHAHTVQLTVAIKSNETDLYGLTWKDISDGWLNEHRNT